MIEPGTAGKSEAGADFSRGASASGRPGTAPPRCARPVRFSGVSSRRPSRGLFEPVGVVEAAEHRGADDIHPVRQAMPVGVGLDGESLGRVGDARSEAFVRAVVFVPGGVLVEDAAEVVLGEGDQVVQAFPADRADEALAVGVGLWSPVGGLEGAHAEALDGVVDLAVEVGGTVVDEEAVGVVANECIRVLAARWTKGHAPTDRRIVSQAVWYTQDGGRV